MGEKLWKTAQRKICRMLGGESTGVTGKADSDCRHPWLAVEIKTRRSIPRYIKAWMGQARRNAEPSKLPIVVWHGYNDLYGNAMVMLSLQNFLDWFGNGGELPWAEFDREGKPIGNGDAAQAALGGAEELPVSDDLYFVDWCQRNARAWAQRQGGK